MNHEWKFMIIYVKMFGLSFYVKYFEIFANTPLFFYFLSGTYYLFKFSLSNCLILFVGIVVLDDWIHGMKAFIKTYSCLLRFIY